MRIDGLFAILTLLLTSCAGQIHWIETPSWPNQQEKIQIDVPPIISMDQLAERLVDLSSKESNDGPNRKFLTAHWKIWNEILTQSPSLGRQITILTRLATTDETPLAKYWANRFLYELYRSAGLYIEAAGWLRRALQVFPNAKDWVHLAWLDLFQATGSQSEAYEAFKNSRGHQLSPMSQNLQNLVRRKLFYQRVSVTEQGLDDNISCLAADQDDLWIATWNGGLARYSVPTNRWDVLLKPGTVVSPIKYLVITRWFVYVFRDKLLSRFSKITDTWRDFLLPVDWSGLRVESAVAVGDDELFVANLGRGFWKWKDGEWMDMSQALPTKFINTVAPAVDGWWIGTQDKGGGFLSKDGLTFKPWWKGPMNVTFIVPTPKQLLVGSFGTGLWSGPPNDLKEVEKSPRYVVAGLVSRKTGFFWGGSLDHGAFYLFNGKITIFSADQDFFFTDVTSLADVGQHIWWGSTTDGLGAWYDHTP